MKLIKNYMGDAVQRQKLNALAKATFGLDFEPWVAGGYFEGDYLPYSLEEDGRLLSNVSVNQMTFLQQGQLKHYIQIGTVMTAASHRRQGLARRLMEEVLRDWEGRCDGLYLFSDEAAVGFYQKLGFCHRVQTRYSLRPEVAQSLVPGKARFEPLPLGDEALRQRYLDFVRRGLPFGDFEQLNRYGLQLFYTAELKNVTYCRELDCFAVLAAEGEALKLQSVLSLRPLTLAQILPALPLEGRRLLLGFTPKKEDAPLTEAAPYDDALLHCRGEQLAAVESQKLCFPELSYA